MRWVMVSLLLMNLAYFGWQYANPKIEAPLPEAQIPGVPTLQLLTERGELPPKALVIEQVQQDSPEPSPLIDLPAAVAAGEPKPQACYTIGPFAGLAAINRATNQFDEAGFVTQQRAVAEKVRTGYWVYVGPHATVKQARDVLKSMKEKGLRDVLIVSGSEPANAISVGVFRNEASAMKRQQEIEQAGYAAKLEERHRSEARYWLDIEVWKPDLDSDSVWQPLMAEVPDAKRDVRECR